MLRIAHLEVPGRNENIPAGAGTRVEVGVGDCVQVMRGTGVARGNTVTQALALGVAVATGPLRVSLGEGVRVAKTPMAGISDESSAS
jgi:hypothetical protein